MNRLGMFLAGLVMFLFFGVGAILSFPVFAISLLWFLFTGSESAKNMVGFKGKALDQLFNAVFLKGHPKETVSSHAGRWILSGKPLPLWVKVLNPIVNIAEKDHFIKAVEEPFKDIPLEL